MSKAEPTQIFALELTDSAMEAMEELAAATGRAGEGHLAQLIQDALRTFEWLQAEQAKGRHIVSIDIDAMKTLAASVEPSEIVRLADLT